MHGVMVPMRQTQPTGPVRTAQSVRLTVNTVDNWNIQKWTDRQRVDRQNIQYYSSNFLRSLTASCTVIWHACVSNTVRRKITCIVINKLHNIQTKMNKAVNQSVPAQAWISPPPNGSQWGPKFSINFPTTFISRQPQKRPFCSSHSDKFISMGLFM